MIDSLERHESKDRRFSELISVYVYCYSPMERFSSHDWPPLDARRISIVYNRVCCQAKSRFIYSNALIPAEFHRTSIARRKALYYIKITYFSDRSFSVYLLPPYLLVMAPTGLFTFLQKNAKSSSDVRATSTAPLINANMLSSTRSKHTRHNEQLIRTRRSI